MAGLRHHQVSQQISQSRPCRTNLMTQVSKGVNLGFNIILVQNVTVSTIMTGAVVIPSIGKDLAITALVLILILQAGIPEVSLIIDRPIRLGIWRVHRLPS